MLRDIDLKLLEIFCCVYEKRSLTKATQCLHTSQSTLSFHIKNLEKRIGQKLFYRKGKALVPTTVADRLYDYARELMDFKLRLVEDLSRLSGRRGGVIRLGASSIPGNHILPELIGEFVESFGGDVSVELEIGDSASVYEGITSGRFDLGVVGYLPSRKGVEFRKLFEDRIWPVANPELEDRVYTLEDLKNLPLVIREEGSGTRSTLEEVLQQHVISLKDMNIIAVMGSNTAIVKFLRRVKAISFLSSYVLKGDDFLVKLRISGLSPIARSFYLIRDPSRPVSNAVEELIEFLITKSGYPSDL